MPFRILSALVLFFLISGITAQKPAFRFPATELDRLGNLALEKIRVGDTSLLRGKSHSGPFSGFSQLEARKEALGKLNLNFLNKTNGMVVSDTLYITDITEITGNWMHTGTIVIAGSGSLRFTNADATILGDIYLVGANPSLISDSSTLYIPQSYFYQRMVFASGGGRVIYRNSTVDHSGLSHNILLIDSARLELLNVVNNGFTTNGIYGKSEVFVNGTNEAGEYVILDESTLDFRNANTLLLWHHFPQGSEIDLSFPEGDTTYNYHFGTTRPGINGIGYEIRVDSCTRVMWGLMPENNTDITVSDSRIRAIGLWFMGSDTVTVNGLVNNSDYENYVAPLTDRNLRLINSRVTTWSIYPMENSSVNLSGCIVGEVGSGKRSTLMGQSYFCDGSGGYVWASDSSLMVNGFSFVSGYVRSQLNGMVILAYSALSAGYPSALQQSMLMVLQCNLPAEPRALDRSVVWYANIEQPFEAEAETIVTITGSAWIDKPEASSWMEFGSYRLFHRHESSDTWTEIVVDSLREKRREILGTWNTSGLSPGNYIVKLVIADNWGNKAEAMKSIMLQPSFGITYHHPLPLKVFPNPANDLITIEMPENVDKAMVTVSDAWGRPCLTKQITENDGSLLVAGLEPGLYVVSLSCENDRWYSRLLVK